MSTRSSSASATKSSSRPGRSRSTMTCFSTPTRVAHRYSPGRYDESDAEGGMAELDGRVAIVTGSSSGIGEETARRLAALGAHVVVNSSSSVEAGEAVAAALQTESMYVQA